MNPTQWKSQIPFVPAIAFLLCSAASVPRAVSAAPQQPAQAPPSHDMEHMQHNHGGLLQEGMHHAVANATKLEQQVDAATHTLTVREGPITLPANTNHMKTPQPPDAF